MDKRLTETGVAVVMSFRMAPPLPWIFLLMIHVVSADLSVSYSSSHICALMNSSVIMNCTYTYPTGCKIEKVFWTKNPVKGKEPPDLCEDPEYSQRLQYLGDKQQNCTIRLSHVTQNDQHMYCFRFLTNETKGKWTGYPGVTLNVTDLQVEAPERVTEGHNVRLTCKSSCTLTDRATFIWYRNSQPLTERRDRNNQLLLQSVRREDAGRYSCALHGHTYISPAAQLNVTYPPKNVSVSINGSGVILEGDSVTLICSSDSNPPALNFSWFKGRMFVGSGRIYSISNISSDHSEEYKCRSINEHGEKYSDAVTLNVMYPPRNVSVSITGSGVILEGDSVTLICSSDSNPPALNFSWFKENQSSAVGSGQSFSALQNGRFYCEAHNQHGSQRSDAVTVTVHPGADGNVIVIAATSGGLFITIIIVLLIMRKRKSDQSEDLTMKQNDLYADVPQRVSVHDESLSEPDPVNDALYASVKPSRPRGETPESRDTEEIQDTTVQYHRKKERKRPEEDECQYDNICSSAAMRFSRKSNVQTVEDVSVIYSNVG
ncbi:B-cell receptor CD22 [Carassius gibelio]|uniref:B-cell receptor CD22 n=1 Tax=Carassius gibelio TaxID=101364 RepID=UPI002279A37D|nr:B-cell receptor CD22 [Carassius gibelio]